MSVSVPPRTSTLPIYPPMVETTEKTDIANSDILTFGHSVNQSAREQLSSLSSSMIFFGHPHQRRTSIESKPKVEPQIVELNPIACKRIWCGYKSAERQGCLLNVNVGGNRRGSRSHAGECAPWSSSTYSVPPAEACTPRSNFLRPNPPSFMHFTKREAVR